jgi:hypothetical protein
MRKSAPTQASLLLAALPLALLAACSHPLPHLRLAPPLKEQKAELQNGQLRLFYLTDQAVLDVWGPPTYKHHEYTRFFTVESGMYVPFFRVPLGEAPKGWDNGVVHGEADFLAYVERGELLGFLGDRLVYREQVPASGIHAVGKMWEKEALFRTDLEKALSPPPP